ncbi:hypothetical protein E2C01_043762 [Portunus trituberculatus]|uniref:Uncharacterized protein n=1 Tax=Portunus trituberculatus TaxID=210409 RepID=A0A5B7FWZ3_PORTR|nr:hypothetical protein [Portunus trituberculatus]
MNLYVCADVAGSLFSKEVVTSKTPTFLCSWNVRSFLDECDVQTILSPSVHTKKLRRKTPLHALLTTPLEERKKHRTSLGKD